MPMLDARVEVQDLGGRQGAGTWDAEVGRLTDQSSGATVKSTFFLPVVVFLRQHFYNDWINLSLGLPTWDYFRGVD